MHPATEQKAVDSAWLYGLMADFERDNGQVTTSPIRTGDPVRSPDPMHRSLASVVPSPPKPVKAAKVPKVKADKPAQRGVLAEIVRIAQAGRAKLHPLVLEHNAKRIKVADTAKEAGVSVGQIMIIRGELGLTVKRRRLAA
jgi:hypothetical protein